MDAERAAARDGLKAVLEHLMDHTSHVVEPVVFAVKYDEEEGRVDGVALQGTRVRAAASFFVGNVGQGPEGVTFYEPFPKVDPEWFEPEQTT